MTLEQEPAVRGAPPPMREERHFDGRVLRCFAERPNDIGEMLDAAVARRPDGDALVFEGGRLSFRALAERVDRVAANLLAAGVAAGHRIAVLLGNRPEFLLAILAAQRIGALAVPMNVRQSAPEIAWVLDHCSAKVVVHEAALTDRLPSDTDSPALDLRVAAGGPASGSVAFEDLLAPATPGPRHAPHEEDPAFILYTSGTTGRPKGAMLTHLNVVHSVMHYEYLLGLRDTDRMTLAVPASHVTGLVANLLTMLRVAGASLVLPAFRADDFLALAARETMTATIMVPAMYKLCLMAPSFRADALHAWRIGGYGGAAMPEATIRDLATALPRLALANVYGATETTSPTTVMPPEETARRGHSVGRTVPCGELRVVRADGTPAAIDEPGELWIRGPMVIPGYWCDPPATRDAFVDGFWRSGDVARVDEEGFVCLLDRLKDVINRGGYKIYCVEVENVLAHHPAVTECAVVPYPDPVLGERVHAFVHCTGATPPAEVLRALCAERLADYKVPDRITFLAEPLPRNANGKIDKRALR